MNDEGSMNLSEVNNSKFTKKTFNMEVKKKW